MPEPQERREAEAQSALFAEDPASCGCSSVRVLRGSAAFALGSCREPEFEWLYFERNVATGSTGRELTVLCTLHFARCPCLHLILCGLRPESMSGRAHEVCYCSLGGVLAEFCWRTAYRCGGSAVVPA